MYSIIGDSKEIGITEAPTYIRKQSNGYYILCDECEACGIVLNNTPYQLINRPSMGADIPAVQLVHIDTGSRITEQQSAIAKTDASLEYLYMMTDVELPEEEKGVEADAQPEI